jgi:hypothetical protein
MRAIKIMMKNETPNSNNPKDIISLYIENESGRIEEYKIEKLYDMLIENSHRRIFVNNSMSYLIPVCSMNGQKYVRSLPNNNTLDEIMKLPRC